MPNRFNIYAFQWFKELNTFIVDNPIFGIHPITREEFYIVNEDTGGFRRFRYVKTYAAYITETDEELYNHFESEDGIYCAIRIKQDR
jgi:hypothetical protein